LFLGGGVLLALVAASNVSLFLLSRAPGRRRELSVRIAVGAPLKRLARQLVTESSLLVAAATALGVLASLWLTVAMRNLAFLRQAQWRDATPFDWRVLVLVVGFTLLLSVLVSLAPIAGIRRIGIAAGSRTITAHAGWGQRIAGTVQIVIAAVIGAAALAFVWYLGDLSSRERGFSAPNVIAVRFEAPRNRGPLVNPEAGLLEHERRRESIAAVPGIDSVAFGTWAPGTGSMLFISPTAPPDDPDDVFNVDRYVVDRAYFDMLGVRLLYGRALDDGERDGVVINATLARRLWGRTDVVGEILPPPRNAGQSGTEPPRWPVVGVVEDITFGHPSQSVRPSAFAALTNPTGFELALIETRSSVADIQRELQQRFDAGELDRKIELVQHVEDAWSQQLAPDRARMTLTLASAVLVVVLAAFGFYGTQRFLVAAGRREYAILAALGAGPRALGRLVLRRGLIQGVPGLVLGPVLAFIVVAWMRDDFVSEAVSPIVTAGSVAFGIVALLLAATIGPARQARDTDPGPLLKEE
jgi:ABC-type lipoprotein release transport system permease subunit